MTATTGSIDLLLTKAEDLIDRATSPSVRAEDAQVLLEAAEGYRRVAEARSIFARP